MQGGDTITINNDELTALRDRAGIPGDRALAEELGINYVTLWRTRKGHTGPSGTFTRAMFRRFPDEPEAIARVIAA